MNEVKKIALKGLILIIALVIMNFVYQATLWQSDLEEYTGLTTEITATKDADILYLGDCSDAYFGHEKDNEKGISQLLDSMIVDKKVATISEIGFHAGMYKTLLKNIPINSKVKTVIVTMNLRSFAAVVLHTPINNSLNQRIEMLNNNYPPLLNRFLLIFNKAIFYSWEEVNDLREKAWENDIISLGKYHSLYDWKTAFENCEDIKFDENWTAQMKEQHLSYIYNYAFQVDINNNPRIADFDQIVTLAKKRNWKLVFHLLPENTSKADALLGKELTNYMYYNQKLLNQRYNINNGTVIDNLELLNDTNFIEENPNSHFHYNGRKLMAKRIKNEIINFIE